MNALNCVQLQHYQAGSTNVIPTEAIDALYLAVASLQNAAKALRPGPKEWSPHDSDKM